MCGGRVDSGVGKSIADLETPTEYFMSAFFYSSPAVTEEVSGMNWSQAESRATAPRHPRSKNIVVGSIRMVVVVVVLQVLAVEDKSEVLCANRECNNVFVLVVRVKLDRYELCFLERGAGGYSGRFCFSVRIIRTKSNLDINYAIEAGLK